MNAVALVEDEVRELVARRGLDPIAHPTAVRRLVEEVIADYDERSVAGALPTLTDGDSAARDVFDAVAGFQVAGGYVYVGGEEAYPPTVRVIDLAGGSLRSVRGQLPVFVTG